MARTKLQVIQKVAQILDQKLHMSGTAASSGNTVGSVKSDDLKRFNDNEIIGKYFYFTSGTPSPDSAVIKDFTNSTGVALIRPELAAAPDSEAFTLLPYRKSDIEDAIADATFTLHDNGDLIREILMYGVVSGSPIYNAGFDYWTSATTPDGWERNGSATLAKEPAGANTFNSRQSLSVSGAADYVRQSEPWKSWLEDFKGGSFRFFCPVLANNANHARIAVFDGNTTHFSDYHSGDGARSILDTGNITIEPDATDLEIRLVNDDTNAVFFGDGWIEGSNVNAREIPIPLDFISDIAIVESTSRTRPSDTDIGLYRHLGRNNTVYDFQVSEHVDHETTTRFGILEFIGINRPGSRSAGTRFTGIIGIRRPGNGVRLKITGSGRLSVPATDAGVIEVTRTEELMLADLAAALLIEGDASRRNVAVAEELRRTAFDLRSKVEELSNGIGQKRQTPTLSRSM